MTVPINMAVSRFRSLAYATHLSILAFQGCLRDRQDYLVAESSGNPGYFWGNLLVMNHEPRPGDFQVWTGLFKKEFAHQPRVKHMTFGWDSPEGLEGDVEPFLSEGFELERSAVLTLKEGNINPPKHSCPDLKIRPLESDEDWEAALQNQIACRTDHFRKDMYLAFKENQMNAYRAMAESGHGSWYGAFLNKKLVADCGLFIFGGTGRFQSVGTDPEFRNRGMCGNLIYQVSRAALSGGRADILVMVADPEYHAARVYESVGFKPTEKAIGLCRWPKEDWEIA